MRHSSLLPLVTPALLTLVCGAAAFAQQPLHGQEDAIWKPIREEMGREGHVDDGILRINFARTDLGKTVTIDQSEVEPDMVYESWFSFMPMGTGKTMMMGDICMKQSEVAEVQRAVLMAGMEISALHNHVLNESHPMVFMHISADGDGVGIARTLKTILSRTTTPTGTEQETTDGKKPDWSAVQKVLGKDGEVEGGKIEFLFPRADLLKMRDMPMPSGEGFETANEAAFAMVGGGQAVVYAEFLLTPEEVTPTLRAFVEHGMTIQALHNHMIHEQPRLIFVHAWGRGDPVKLADGVKAALEKSNVKKP
jgi:hypothetical protein